MILSKSLVTTKPCAFFFTLFFLSTCLPALSVERKSGEVESKLPNLALNTAEDAQTSPDTMKYLAQIDKMLHWGKRPANRVIAKTLGITGFKEDLDERYTLTNADTSSLWASVDVEGRQQITLRCNPKLVGITVDQLKKRFPRSRKSSEYVSTDTIHPVLAYNSIDKGTTVQDIFIIWYSWPAPVHVNHSESRPPKPVNGLPGKMNYLPFTFMKLPAGNWEKPSNHRCNPDGYCLDLNLTKLPEVTLQISTPGKRWSPSKEYKDMFFAPPHELSKVELERYRENESIKTAHTEDFNGKRVLVKTGVYEGKNYYQLTFNHNPDSSNIWVEGEIEFSAPPEEYDRYLGNVKECLHLIRWRKDISCQPSE